MQWHSAAVIHLCSRGGRGILGGRLRGLSRLLGCLLLLSNTCRGGGPVRSPDTTRPTAADLATTSPGGCTPSPRICTTAAGAAARQWREATPPARERPRPPGRRRRRARLDRRRRGRQRAAGDGWWCGELCCSGAYQVGISLVVLFLLFLI